MPSLLTCSDESRAGSPCRACSLVLMKVELGAHAIDSRVESSVLLLYYLCSCQPRLLLSSGIYDQDHGLWKSSLMLMLNSLAAWYTIHIIYIGS